MRFLEWPPIKKVRRSHGLEHATVHVLAEAQPTLSLVGRASVWGFTIYGDVDTATLTKASQEALRRMQAGQGALAVHPRCGTNLAVTGLLAGLSSALVAREKSPWRRLGVAVWTAAAVVLSSQSLGLQAQKHVTTTADLEGVRIAGVSRHQLGRLALHRVHLTQP